MKNIVLTGFMASGKTTVGKRLSELTGYKFSDIDCIIEKNAGKTINAIFADSGEEYFRDMESLAAKECGEYENSVIACGGGTVLRKENIEALRKNGVIFNLEPTEEVIRYRLEAAAATRPLLKRDSISEVLERFERRKPFYDICDYKIKVILGKGIDETAEEILNIYKSDIK